MAGKGDIVKGALEYTAKLLRGADEPVQAGIRAYHGSPHDYPAERLVQFPDQSQQYIVGTPNALPDVPEGATVLQDFPLGRMRMDKIGTGEGAQAYGHGLYAAEAEPTARDYRDALTDRASSFRVENVDMPKWILRGIENSPDKAAAIAKYREDFSNRLLEAQKEAEGSVQPWLSSGRISSAKDVLAGLDALERGASMPHTAGRMYELNINADPNTFLDWDKPLSEQPKQVQEALAAMDPDMYSPGGADYDPTEPGQIIYQRLAAQKRDYGIDSGRNNLTTLGGAQAGATSDLQGFGIPGIKYLDAGSRGAGEGTRNYVVFDDKLISIIRKYGIAGASAMLGYNLMEQLDPIQARAAEIADREYQDTAVEDRDGYAGRGRVIDKGLENALRIAREGLEGLAKEKGKTPREIGQQFGNQLPRVPYEEWRYEFEPTGTLLERKPLDLTGMKEGDVLIPLVGDRTSNARKITSIGGQPLSFPTITEGGPDYMRGPAQMEQGSVWASGKGVVSGLNDRMARALRASEEAGYKDPSAYGVYVAMGPHGGDFSTHTAEAVMGMMPGSKITKRDAKEFDRNMKEIFPDWPGIMSEKAPDYVVNANAGEHRKAFIDMIDSAYWRDKGFPDVSMARYATTTPELLDVPTEAAGYAVAKLDPSAPKIETIVPHRSYPMPMQGEYIGSMPKGLMRDDVFTTFSKNYDLNPPARNYVMGKRRSFGMDPNAFQVLEGRDLEDLIAKSMRLKENYAEGGAVEDEGWLDAAYTAARNAADKATFGTAKYAAAGTDYLTDAALDALGYENDADYLRSLAEQEYALKEGEEKHPAAAGAGDIAGYAAPYIVAGPAGGAMSTLNYLSDYGGKIGKTGSLFMRALGYADGGAVDDDIHDALRIAKDVGGGTSPQVMMEDALGNKYDAQGKIIPPTNPGENPARSQFDAPPQNYETEVKPFINAAMTPMNTAQADPNSFTGTQQAEEPSLVEAMKIAGQLAASGQQQEDVGPENWRAKREQFVRGVMGAPENGARQEYQGPFTYNAPEMADYVNTLLDYVPNPLWATEYPHDLAYEAVRTGDYGPAALEGAATLAFTPMGARAAKDAYRGVRDFVAANPALVAGTAGAGAMTMGAGEAEAGPARWFSKAMEVAKGIPMEKMTGEQALAMLRKSVSPEELRWTGTDAFLSGKKSVSKGDLLEHLQNNRMQLNEVVLGGGNKPTRREDVVLDDEIKAKYREQMGTWQRAQAAALGRVSRAKTPEEIKKAEDDAWAIKRHINDINNAAIDEQIKKMGGLGLPLRYGPGSQYGEKYVTPGGTDYRETLITLPQLPGSEPTGYMVYGAWPRSFATKQEAEDYAAKVNAMVEANDPNMSGVIEDIRRNPPVIAPEYNEKDVFKSSHWSGYPNVAAHTRTQILETTPPGANRPYKAFNVDEAQSDWAKSGRDQGFYTSEAKKKAREEIAAIGKQIKELQASSEANIDKMADIHMWADSQLGEMPPVSDRFGRQQWLDDKRNLLANHSEYAAVKAANDENSRIISDLRRRELAIERENAGVPSAPYVGSTQAWTDLSIKKSLDQALDSGADYFTFTPGDIQAKRYSLRNQIDELHYDAKNRTLFGRKNGNNVFEEDNVEPDKLGKYVGKGVAERLLSQPTKESKWYASPRHVLSGQELEIGGEGMIDYYNNIYKKRVEKVVKDATGKKVEWEVITVNTADGPREQLGFRISDMQDARFSDFNKGGRVTDGAKYADSDTVNRALALTSEV